MPDSPPMDLNADLGEGFGVWRLTDDEQLLDIVTSANVACGFHAGDPRIMHRVCELAVQKNVRIGAQVSYRDLAGFGRREMDVAPHELRDDVLYQIGALEAFARVSGERVSYVKPHGALNNRTWWDDAQAAAIAEAVHAYDPTLPILALPGSALERAARDAALTVVHEAFADRNYESDASLVSRRRPNALLTDHTAIADRITQLVRDRAVTAVDGSMVALDARSICVHGDSPGAVHTAKHVRAVVEALGASVEAFA